LLNRNPFAILRCAFAQTSTFEAPEPPGDPSKITWREKNPDVDFRLCFGAWNLAISAAIR
jgi:hypothetical protein